MWEGFAKAALPLFDGAERECAVCVTVSWH